jgi:hypothetical protein
MQPPGRKFATFSLAAIPSPLLQDAPRKNLLQQNAANFIRTLLILNESLDVKQLRPQSRIPIWFV